MTDRITRAFSSPATTFYLEADVVDTDESYGSYGRWKVRLYLRAKNGPGGTTGSSFSGSGFQAGRINGTERIRKSGNPFLPSGYADNATRWRSGPVDYWVNANSNGYWSGSSTVLPLQMQTEYGNVDDYAGGSISLPRISRAPGKSGKPVVSNITPTGAKFTWAAAGRGNAPITDYHLVISRFSDFSSPAYSSLVGDDTTATVSSILAPGTPYYARVRAINNDGNGAWSDSASFTTLPASPPGLTITPSISGAQATVVVTPPGGTTGVTKYVVEVSPSVPGVGTSFELVPPTTSRVISSLTPGKIYSWRASAFYGTYQTPWTALTPVQQPNPNTAPGQYFDGSTVDTSQITYDWAGTTNLSKSTASMVSPLGWWTFATGAAGTGATGVVARVTDSAPDAEGTRSARAVFMSDATAAGFLIGTAGVYVQGLVQYVGSIWVKSSKATRLRARISFFDAASAHIVSYDGDEIQVEPEVWTRLTVTQQSPPNAYYAGIFAMDVVGTGHALWQGGDTLTADAAMISLAMLYPYFDGDTPDTLEYSYHWMGTANQSESRRLTKAISATDPLLDPDCAPLPTPPALPTIESDCIEEVGTWRRYTLAIPSSEIREWSSTLPTLEMRTGSFSERQVRIRVYANPDDVAPELVDTTTWEAEMILSFIPKRTEIVLDGVTQRVWANLSDGRQIPADQLLYGTGGVPATWPELRCGIGYVVTLDVPLDAPSGNLTTDVILTQRM